MPGKFICSGIANFLYRFASDFQLAVISNFREFLDI